MSAIDTSPEEHPPNTHARRQHPLVVDFPHKHTPSSDQTHSHTHQHTVPRMLTHQTLKLTVYRHCGDGRAGGQGSTEVFHTSVRDVFKVCVRVPVINTSPHEERHTTNVHTRATCWCGLVPTSTRRATSHTNTPHQTPSSNQTHRIHTNTRSRAYQHTKH